MPAFFYAQTFPKKIPAVETAGSYDDQDLKKYQGPNQLNHFL